MDGQIIYPGQIPLDTDLLSAQRFAKINDGMIAQMMLGTPTVVDGLACTPTAPASLIVHVAPGSIFALGSIDASAFGTLATDVRQIVKQGLVLSTTSLTMVPPATSGHAVNILIQAAFSEVDDTAVLLPYYNSADPSQPYSGPENSGTTQYTVRRGKCILATKVGSSATAGTQTTPTPDAGYVPLWVVTVANGATTISSGNIAQHADAPFLLAKLPQVPGKVQGGDWLYGVDTGTANAMVAAFTPAITALKVGMGLRIKKINAVNTGAVTLNVGTGAYAVVKASGAALSADDLPANMVLEVVWDGASFQCQNYMGVQSSTSTVNNSYTLSIPFCVDASVTPNLITATFSPAITSLAAGNPIEVKLANAITGATTIVVNALSAIPVVRPNGRPLQNGDAFPGQVLLLLHDGTNFQLLNPASSQLPLSTFVKLTTPGAYTWTVPAGVYRVKARAWGAGGGGGYTTGGAPSGGGGAAYIEKTINVVPGQTVTGVIGTGGVGGSQIPAQNGLVGGSTTVVYAGTTYTAGGGPGGLNSAYGNGNSPGSGTPSGSFDVGLYGEQGGIGITSVTGALGGRGGGAPYGGVACEGGQGAPSGGSIPGGGGGGSGDPAYAGGPGGRGEVWIEYLA